MDILELVKKILNGENKGKIIGLTALLILCFVLVYVTNDPLKVTSDIDNNSDEQQEIISSDFASVLSSVEGAGKVSVYITYVDEDKTQVMGVIIVAEGAKDLNVAMKLQQAAATAYGIGIDRIEVFKMKGVN